jgi:hypothetical protein
MRKRAGIQILLFLDKPYEEYDLQKELNMALAKNPSREYLSF